MSSGDEALNKLIKGLFEFLGNLIKGIFFLSKEAAQKPSVKSISVGGNQSELQTHYQNSKAEYEKSNLKLYRVYDLASEILSEALQAAQKQSNLNFQIPFLCRFKSNLNNK